MEWMIQATEPTRSLAGRIGYEMGYFVGSHVNEILVGLLVVLLTVLYFAFFRKIRKR